MSTLQWHSHRYWMMLRWFLQVAKWIGAHPFCVVTGGTHNFIPTYTHNSIPTYTHNSIPTYTYNSIPHTHITPSPHTHIHAQSPQTHTSTLTKHVCMYAHETVNVNSFTHSSTHLKATHSHSWCCPDQLHSCTEDARCHSVPSRLPRARGSPLPY